jgi:uncharacterized membrane protein YhaH (DUF805 family)
MPGFDPLRTLAREAKTPQIGGPALAYSDTIGDNAYLLKRTLRGVGDFKGRSRRTEVIYYWIATVLIGVTIGFVRVTLAPFQSMIWLDVLTQAIFVIPMFALFVRRLHDQGRSGWWGLLLPVALLLSIPERLNEIRGDVGEILAQKTSLTAIALDLIAIAILVLFLWPGTAGPNRFGPDPRLKGS